MNDEMEVYEEADEKNLFDLARDAGWSDDKFDDHILGYIGAVMEAKLEHATSNGAQSYRMEFRDMMKNTKLVIEARSESIISLSDAIH